MRRVCAMSELPGSLSRPSGRKVLDNYDVLLKILEDVSASLPDESQGRRSEPSSAQRDLAACARVCHSFTEPALRLLWAQIDSLVPLWSLLAPASVTPPKTCTDEFVNLVRL